MATGFLKKNIEREQRNGKSPESQYVVKYITQIDRGNDGQDAYQAFLSPNNCTFTEGGTNQTSLVNVFAFRGSNQLDTMIGAITCTDINGNTIPTTQLDTSISYNGTNRAQITIIKYGSL